jgi:ABC-2 type transport system ATP-binding protein/ribosome-dependent ATPase
MQEAEQCDRLVVLASGRVAASGTVAEVLGQATAVEVRAGEWEAAFRALDDAGLPMALAGRTLRLPQADPGRVKMTLAGAGVRAEVRTVEATLEEAFLLLAAKRA